MDKIVKFYNARETVHEMLMSRGYNLTDDDKTLNIDIFEEMYKNGNLDLYYDHKETSKLPIYVRFFVAKNKLSENELKKEVNMISVKTDNGDEYDNNPNILFVTMEKSNQNVYNLIKSEKLINVELFHIAELLINVSKTIYAPQFEKLTKEEEKELLKTFNLQSKINLPKIASTDKQVRYYGMKSGDVCRIIRTNSVSGYSVAYKLVRN